MNQFQQRVIPSDVLRHDELEQIQTLTFEDLWDDPEPTGESVQNLVDRERYPWKRQYGESTLDHDLFRRFVLLGPQRTIALLFREVMQTDDPELASSFSQDLLHVRVWYAIATRYDWINRAICYDDFVSDYQFNAYARERSISKRARISMLNELKDLLVAHLPKLSEADLSAKTLIEGVRIVAQELRAEYDDMPRSRSEVSGPRGGPVDVKVSGSVDVNVNDPYADAREKLAAKLQGIVQRRELADQRKQDDSDSANDETLGGDQ